MNPVTFQTAQTQDQLEQILALQRRYLEGSEEQRANPEDGFVTVRHDLALLRDMNDAAPHIVAVADGRVVAYALVMAQTFAPRVPVLRPLFEQLAALQVRGKPASHWRYFVMGQVCVAREYRGRDVFAGLYHRMRDGYAGAYDFVVTEIATRNPRSIAAHRKVGFELLHRYREEDGEQWEVVAWHWR